MGPCHHDMRPGVPDGGDDLQIWSVVANIMNKQWPMGSPPALGFGGG